MNLSFPLTGGTLYGRPVIDAGVLARLLREMSDKLEHPPLGETSPAAHEVLTHLAGGLEALEMAHQEHNRGRLHHYSVMHGAMARAPWSRTPPV